MELPINPGILEGGTRAVGGKHRDIETVAIYSTLKSKNGGGSTKDPSAGRLDRSVWWS